MEIIDYLKQYFDNNGITQKEIESKVHISQDKVSLIFNGKRKLTADELLKIAKEYNLDLNKLKEITQSTNLK